MPGLCKIKFHTILAIRNGKAEIQFMASETESLEQLPIPSAMNGIIRGKPVKKVRSLFFLMVLHISLKLSKSNMILFFFDTFNQPVLYPDNPVCSLRYGGFVGNDYHGHTFKVYLA